MAKIFYTRDEEMKLAQKMFTRWCDKPLDSAKQIYEHVMKADWPADRRRKIAGMTQVPQSYKEFQRLIMERINGGPPAAAPISPEDVSNKPPQIIYMDRVVEPDPQAFMRKQPMQILLLEVMSRFTGEWADIKDELQLLRQRSQGSNSPVRVPSPQPEYVRPPEAVNKPVYIGVVGLERQLFNEAQDQCKGKAELVYLSRTETSPKFPTGVHHVVVNAHTPCHWTDASKKYDKDAVYHVGGGKQAVVQKVFDILSDQKPRL